ncbi:hypothetical protein PR003_g23994 [Phytophthora rubi]|uniref:Cas12f1-like TNB domain-containing protein n=1 Tax=Phytophthora rubi TaxID=129364 RepID=A0A6A4D0E6_9STRA|nr:hypothetical protein PR001_g22778 [Phytophthora rubi]KAE9295528.1 hypothetical protein PR003_g23994 [Phytophthora rubi]
MSNPVPTPEHMARLLRVRGGKYYLAFSTLKEFKKSTGTREGGMDPGVRKFGTVMDTEGLTLSVTDDGYLKRRYDAIDANKSTLAKLDNAAKAATKARHPIKLHTKEKVAIAMQNKKEGVSVSKSSDHRRRARLRREINATNLKITNAVKDFHHKFSSWIASNFKTFLLPSFQTSLMVRKYEQQMAADGTPESLSQFKVHRGRKRRILSSTARGMLGLCHYSFSELLRYKMERVGGKMITCEEEYTSKSCSGCGKLKENLGGSVVYKCVSCGAHMDRDLNGAKNILIKNIEMLF